MACASPIAIVSGIVALCLRVSHGVLCSRQRRLELKDARGGGIGLTSVLLPCLRLVRLGWGHTVSQSGVHRVAV